MLGSLLRLSGFAFYEVDLFAGFGEPKAFSGKFFEGLVVAVEFVKTAAVFFDFNAVKFDFSLELFALGVEVEVEQHGIGVEKEHPHKKGGGAQEVSVAQPSGQAHPELL